RMLWLAESINQQSSIRHGSCNRTTHGIAIGHLMSVEVKKLSAWFYSDTAGCGCRYPDRSTGITGEGDGNHPTGNSDGSTGGRPARITVLIPGIARDMVKITNCITGESKFRSM